MKKEIYFQIDNKAGASLAGGPGKERKWRAVRQKSKAQIYLERVEMMDCIIENKLKEQRQWRDIALGITANMDGQRVQSSGSLSPMADAINRCVDMEREIDAAVDTLVDIKREVVATLEQLDSPTEYRFLHMRYIQHKSLQEIADHYGREYGWATTTHGRAVAHVQEILDKKEMLCDAV